MDKEVARFQSLEQLHERRKQVVRLHRQGMGVMRIVALNGLSYPTVRRTIDRYEDGVHRRTSPSHVASDWDRSAAQQDLIQRIICDK